MISVTGKAQISFVKKRREKKKKLKKIWHKIVKVTLGSFLTLILFILILGATIFWKYSGTLKEYYEDAKETVATSTPDDFRKHDNSYVYSDDGEQLVKLCIEKDIKYVKFEDIPEGILDAFVAIEDKRFYEHKGTDWLSTGKAAALLVLSKLDGSNKITRGGSTITQQLARNVYLNFETSYERKLREIFLALELEKKYSKDQILEFYINNINYGNGYYGIGAAAQGYFSKDVDELSMQEIAFLCAIPNNPSYYDPIKHFENTISRRNTILNVMHEQQFLTDEEHLVAINSPIKLNVPVDKFYNYESSFAIDCAIKTFMQMNGFQFVTKFSDMQAFEEYQETYSEAYNEAKIKLYTGGYKVYTSINREVQDLAQNAVDNALKDFTVCTDDGIFLYQGACTVIDNNTGKVIAIVGGRTQDLDTLKGVRTLNRAFQSFRQPGSTIKPLIVYTPALENEYTADSILHDVPIENGPNNADGKYLGDITLRTAVEQSRNCTAWQLITDLGVENCLKYVQNMGFSKIVPDDYYAPASLGGLTYGVSTVEMTGAYATLFNNGVYRETSCIIKILDANGKNIYSEKEGVRIYSEQAASEMTDILQGVAKNGTAYGLALDNGMPIACKTGTTNERKCGWFCGYTPYYTVAVYVGADTNVTMSRLSGNTYPMSIWRDIQNTLCADKEVIQFKKVQSDIVTSDTESEKENENDDSTIPVVPNAQNEQNQVTATDNDVHNENSDDSNSVSPPSSEEQPNDKANDKKVNKPEETKQKQNTEDNDKKNDKSGESKEDSSEQIDSTENSNTEQSLNSEEVQIPEQNIDTEQKDSTELENEDSNPSDESDSIDNESEISGSTEMQSTQSSENLANSTETHNENVDSLEVTE